MIRSFLALLFCAAAFGQAPSPQGQIGGSSSASVSSGAGSVYTTVTYGATVAYTVATSAVQGFSITLTGDITTATLDTTLATAGQEIIWKYCQDGSGGHVPVWPVNVTGYGSVDTTALACSTQSFIWDGANAIADSGMVSDAPGAALVTNAGALALPTAPDTLAGIAATQTLTNKTISGANNTLTIRETDLSTTDVTTGNASTSKHGLMPKLPGTTTTFMNGNGAFTTPTVTQVCDPSDDTQYCLVENFCGGSLTISLANGGTAGWLLFSVGAGTPTVTAPGGYDANHLCGAKVSGQAAVNDGGAIGLMTMNNAARPIPAAMFQSGTFRPFDLRFQASISATTNIRWFAGLLGTSAIPSGTANGCFFHYDTNTPDSGFIGGCGDASTVVNTSAYGTLDTAIHKFRIWSTVQASIHFSIDGTELTGSPLTKTVSTGAPLLFPVIIVSNDATSNNRYTEVYRLFLQITGLVP